MGTPERREHQILGNESEHLSLVSGPLARVLRGIEALKSPVFLVDRRRMACTPKGTTGTCHPCGSRRPEELNTLRAIVNHYIAGYRPRPWVAFHANQPSLERALEVVASWKDEDQKTYSHQCLVPRKAKVAAGAAIRVLDLEGVEDFEQLFQCVQATIGSIRGIGDLAVYDAALRIGAFLGKLPERVYLQRGACVGARALGLDASQRSLPMDVFPAEFRRLQAWEVEDVLCIYADDLSRLARRRRSAA